MKPNTRNRTNPMTRTLLCAFSASLVALAAACAKPGAPTEDRAANTAEHSEATPVHPIEWVDRQLPSSPDPVLTKQQQAAQIAGTRQERAAERRDRDITERRLSDAAKQSVSELHAMPRIATVIAPPAPRHQQGHMREAYEAIFENRFMDPGLSPLSTFGLDVDTASYANMRRILNSGRLPPADAIRLEELVNYFDYSPLRIERGHPIALRTEISHAPWQAQHRLAMIQVAAHSPAVDQRPANRLVFLVDTSGSMNSADKLPLLKRAFRQLVEQLDARDSVAIVTYAGSAGLALPATHGTDKSAIYAAIQHMRAGGSTAGARGIELAYQVARQQFDPRGNNRVILATDGDFNVGPSSNGELVRMIEQHRDQGIFLTVLGFGQGNLQDSKMHRIADHGDGNYYYIDTDLEARRVLVDKLQGTLLTVAKDVKLQVEFNPRHVASYRLLGYETRQLAAEDFRDDRKDAGDVGAGTMVTALYELVPADSRQAAPHELRYQERRNARGHDSELMVVKARYRAPAGGPGTEITRVVRDRGQSLHQSSADLQWAATVAEFGMLLRGSEHRGLANFESVLRRAAVLAERSSDESRREFLGLARQAALLSGETALPEDTDRDLSWR